MGLRVKGGSRISGSGSWTGMKRHLQLGVQKDVDKL